MTARIVRRALSQGFATILMVAWLGFCSLPVLAAEAKVTLIEPSIGQGQLNLDVDFSIELNRVMVDALERGVPLYFTTDLVIAQPRWWWFDRTLIETSVTRRLTYNTLTRQWRLATGDLSVSVASLDEGLAMLRQLRDWPIAPLDRFDRGVRYDGRIRIRLDNAQLARPLQVDALNRGAWSLSSSWAPFDFSIRTSEAEQ